MVDRTLLGRRNNGSYGIDISLPGIDVHTARLDQMVFSDRWSSGSVIHQTGIVSDVFGGGGKVVTFPSLPYIPMVYLLMRQTSGGTVFMSVQYMQLSYGDLRFMAHPFCRVSATTLFFDPQQNGRLPAVGAYDVRYCVFKTQGG